MARSENKQQLRGNRLKKWARIVLILAFITPFVPFILPFLWLLWPDFFCSKLGILSNWGEFLHNGLGVWSNFGEYVGGMGGALLSFAGILLILQTIEDQRQEMREMRVMHEEQQFEATFFQALNGHNELVKSFEMSLPGGRTVNGRVCLLQLYRDFTLRFRGTPTVEQIFDEFVRFSQKDQLIIRQFLQSIEKLVDFTHKSEVGIKVKRDLLGFISAQLTYHEEFFFLLHLASNQSESAVTDFVLQYRLFDCHADAPFLALNQIPLFAQSA